MIVRDYCRAGLDKKLRAMLDYAASDGLISRAIDSAELFAPSTLDAVDSP